MLLSRGSHQAPQRASKERLHGAELPGPEPGAEHPGQRRPRRPGQAQRGAGGRPPGRLGGLAGQQRLVGRGRLQRGPHGLPRPAGLCPDSLELPQPRPQVRAGPRQTRRPPEVAPAALCPGIGF